MKYVLVSSYVKPVFALIALCQVNIQATPLGPVYPAPGGNSWSQTYDSVNNPEASAGGSGGVTWSYSGFDSSAFNDLYWGPSAFGAIYSSLLNGSTMVFEGIYGVQARWNGTAGYFNAFGSYQTVTTWFIATVSGLGASPWVPANSVGLDPHFGAVVENSMGQDYGVNLAFYADLNGGSPSDAIALDDVYHEEHSSNQLNGGFFYTSSVPDYSSSITNLFLLLPIGIYMCRLPRERISPRIA